MKTEQHLSPSAIKIWRTIQSSVWLIGLVIVYNLIFYPETGIHLFWNILIPVAPALLVLAVGVWRNVCPMASNALFPRHMGFSKRKKLTISENGKLNLIAVIALFVIVPLRHAIFDMNGMATAILILSLAFVAVVMGYLFEWKSAWCSGLCPVHPVEKLYGINNRLSLQNAHCNMCYKCVTPCPDTSFGTNPMSSSKTIYHRISGFLMVAAFPGFVWGWFQNQDYPGITDIGQLIEIYKMPLIGIVATSILYFILNKFMKKNLIISIFSASAVSCYYWFRLPALFGFGIFPGDGMLIDLTDVIPGWSITIVIFSLTLFFFWWIVFSKQVKNTWATKPPFADLKQEISLNKGV
jgi:hypothetical protein